MLEHRELLSEGQIFQQQATAGAKQASDRHQPKPNNGEHAGRIADTGSSPSGANFLILKTSNILARHRDPPALGGPNCAIPYGEASSNARRHDC